MRFCFLHAPPFDVEVCQGIEIVQVRWLQFHCLEHGSFRLRIPSELLQKQADIL
jgi:hypothetical protein